VSVRVCPVTPLLRETCRCEPQGEIPEGKAPYFRLPIFNYHDGYLSTSYTATYYELAQRHPEVPRLTELQREAVRHFNALARVRGLGLPSRAGTVSQVWCPAVLLPPTTDVQA